MDPSFQTTDIILTILFTISYARANILVHVVYFHLCSAVLDKNEARSYFSNVNQLILIKVPTVTLRLLRSLGILSIIKLILYTVAAK